MEPKDAALHAVGRTVVNFQRLERQLKQAARLGPVEGTLPKVQRDIDSRVKRSATMTLGQAIQAWLGATADRPSTDGYTPDLFDPTVQMNFLLMMDPQVQDAHGMALLALAETRNRLVHDDLAEFPWDSPGECEGLLRRLTEINEAIHEQSRFLSAVLSSLPITT